MVIIYLTISPIPRDPSPFSCTVTVLVTSRSGIGEILTTVGSSAAAVLVSSEISVTSFVSPGLLAVTRALLIILPVLAAATEIVYLAVYTAFSPWINCPAPDPWEEPWKSIEFPLSKLKVLLFASVKVSTILIPLRVAFPVFDTVIV